MPGTDTKSKRFSTMTWLKAALTGLAVTLPVVGSVYLFKSLNYFDHTVDTRTLTTGTEFGTSGHRIAATAETSSVVQGVGGGATVDASRNVYLFANAFRPELMDGTKGFSEDKQRVRDQILGIIERLVAVISKPSIEDAEVRALAGELATLIAKVSVSPYLLTTGQFTIEPGTAYYLPGGQNALALVGPTDARDPNSVFVRRNGRKVVMRIGSLRLFTQAGDRCRLVLHEIADQFASATFSYTCKPVEM